MSKPFSLFEKILIAMLAVIIIVLLIVTAVTLTGRKSNKSNTIDGINIEVNSIDNKTAGTEPAQKMWTGIGRLRIPLQKNAKDNSLSAIVINVVFPYNNLDRALKEELALNNKKFRTIIKDYFSNTSLKLTYSNEDEIKTTLLNSFNDLLRLGKIQTLYFSEFTLIE